MEPGDAASGPQQLGGNMSFATFVEGHRAQLEHWCVPEALWLVLYQVRCSPASGAPCEPFLQHVAQPKTSPLMHTSYGAQGGQLALSSLSLPKIS